MDTTVYRRYEVTVPGFSLDVWAVDGAGDHTVRELAEEQFQPTTFRRIFSESGVEATDETDPPTPGPLPDPNALRKQVASSVNQAIQTLYEEAMVVSPTNRRLEELDHYVAAIRDMLGVPDPDA